MSPTDPGLDERVCKALGWEPLYGIEWKCSMCGFWTSALSHQHCDTKPAMIWK